MKKDTIKSDALLVLTAVIWGFAFVAQRVGMDHVGPFTYNGVRFALACVALLPLLIVSMRQTPRDMDNESLSLKTVLLGGAFAGSALFLGASFQQIGLLYTTAGNAGFITGLYVVIVPIIGLLWRQRTGKATWIGALLAAMGLYFLSVTERFTISFGDFLEIIGAFFWAGHVHIIGWLSPRIDSVKLAFIQFAACSILSLAAAFILETITLDGIYKAAIPILYGGVLSVGVAYTLQVVAQKNAEPSHAAIILSTEAVFAALGGWLILNEQLSLRGFFGCALMLFGMLISQSRAIMTFKNKKYKEEVI